MSCPLDHDHDTLPCPTDSIQPFPLIDRQYRYIGQVKHVTVVDGERVVSYSGIAIPRRGGRHRAVDTAVPGQPRGQRSIRDNLHESETP